MKKTVLETPAATDEKAARKQARKVEKEARKSARQEERAARVSVCQERELDADALARLLEGIAAGIRIGSVAIEDDQQKSTLVTTGPARVRLKSRRGRKRMRLSLRAVWTPGKPVEPRIS